MRPRLSRYTVWLIGFVVLIYSTLLVMTAGCALTHADRFRSHQHHHSDKGSSDQNLLCAWVCQATVDAAETSGSPSTVTQLAMRPAALASGRFCLLQPSSTVQTRAPPSFSLVRIG